MPGNLQEIPSSVIASWPTPNYDDPIRRTWMPEYAGVLQSLTTIMLGLRLWLRLQRKAGALGFDDALLVPAFLAATMLTAVNILGAEKYGLDRHIWDVRPGLFEYTALVGWLAEIAFLVSTCCTKVSVLLFFRRLGLDNISKKWEYATIGAIIFTVCYGVAFVLALIFNCSPTEAYWKSYSINYHKNYHCADTTVLNPLSGVLGVISDFYSVVLPMGMLWNLEATKPQRWALNGVFSLGLVVVAAGAVRTYYLNKLGTSYDITWVGFDALVWCQAEAHLALCCASAPSLRVFFRRYLSDSVSRAIHSARVTSGKSTTRDSAPPDGLGMAGWQKEQQQRQSTGGPVVTGQHCHCDDPRKVQIDVEEAGRYSPASWEEEDVANKQPIHTPDEYESYALKTLHHQSQSQHYISWHQTQPGH